MNPRLVMYRLLLASVRAPRYQGRRPLAANMPLGHCADPNTPRMKMESSGETGPPRESGQSRTPRQPRGHPAPCRRNPASRPVCSPVAPSTFQLTTGLCAQIRPGALKHVVNSYEAKALDILGNQEG